MPFFQFSVVYFSRETLPKKRVIGHYWDLVETLVAEVQQKKTRETMDSQPKEAGN